MDIVSIIVPVYMVEKYLHRCINSILNQTYSDLDIILVDDGSPDGCGEICDAYAQKDSRIRVIHKENGGVSSARNAGIRLACGSYLTFCDSDDSYAEDWIERLVTTMETNHADCVVGNYIGVYENGQKGMKSCHDIGSYLTEEIEKKIEFSIFEVFSGKMGWEIWTRLFRTDIIRENKVFFCETCENFAEDLVFVLEYLMYCKLTISIPYVGYNYLFRTGSMMRSNEKKAKLNAVNEAALHFIDKCKKVTDSKYGEHIIPIFHWMIMENQYCRIINMSKPCSIKNEIAEIRNYARWRTMTEQLLQCRGTLVDLFGRHHAEGILSKARFCIHGNWLRFKLEFIIYTRV